MADLADFDAVLAPTPAPAAPAVAATPAAAPAPSGDVPVIDVGSGLGPSYSPAAPIGQPGSEMAPSAIGPNGSANAGPAAVLTPAIPHPSPDGVASPAVVPAAADKLSVIDSAIASAPKTATFGDSSPATSAAAATSSPPKISGAAANLAAGANEGIAGTLGAPVDLLTGAINLGSRGVNALAGTDIPPIQNPVGGSRWVENAMGLIGANPQNVEAQGFGQNLMRGIGSGVAGAVLPAGIAGQIPRAMDALGQAAPIVRGVANTLAAPSAAANAVAGAGAGVGGTVAQQVVPQQYSGLAQLAGNLAGGGVAALGMGTAEGALRGMQATGQSALQPVASSNPLMQTMANAVGADVRPRAVIAPSGQIVMASPGQIARVQSALSSAYGQSPADLAASIPSAEDASLIPGSQPTLGQATGNMGGLGLEKTLRTGVGREALAAQEADNNAARLDQIRSLYNPDVQADAAGNYFQKAQRGIDRSGDLAVQAAQQAAQPVAQATGGGETAAGAGERVRAAVNARHKPTVTEALAAEDRARQLAQAADRSLGANASGTEDATARQQYSGNVRDHVAKVVANEKAAISRLYDAVPKDMVLDPAPAKEVAAQIKKEIDPQSGDELSPAVQKWVSAVEGYPDKVRFGALSQTRRKIGEAIRELRRAGNMSDARQLGMLKTGLDDSVNEAIRKTVREEAPKVASGELSQDNSLLGHLAAHAKEGVQEVFTPAGRRIATQPEVVEAANLKTSHNDDLSINPAYPQELQPRDRGRIASAVQIDRMARNLNPSRLGLHAGVNEGAPIVGPDGVVESGNGRVMAMKRAYAQGGPAAQAYRDWVGQHGVDVSGMKEPVLVRTRQTELSPEERAQFAREANEGSGLSLGAAERAQSDAQSISPGTLGKYQQGDIGAEQNRPFVKAMIKDIANGDNGSFVQPDGRLSLGGGDRIRNALLHAAYGSPELVADIAEGGSEDIKAMGNALMDAAPQMARLRSEITSGSVDPRVDIGPRLVEAARLVQLARRTGVPLRDVVAQQDSFRPISAEAEHILRFGYGDNLTGRLSRNRFGAYLKAYAEEAEQQQAQPRLFGENASQAELLRVAGGRARSIPATEPSGTGSNVPEGPRQGGGEGGASPGGSQSGAAGPSVAGRRQGAVVQPEGPPLTPEGAAALKAAIARRAELAQRTQGPADRVLAAGPKGAPYAVSESNVGREFWGKGAEGAQALVRITGSRDAAENLIRDYAAHDLRTTRGMVNPDGSLNPAKFQDWMKSHQEELTVLPGLKQQFENARVAAQTLADVSAARAQIEALNPLAKVEGDAAVISKYFSPGPRGTEAARAFTKDTAGDPAAVQSLSDGIAAQFRDKVMPDGVVNTQAYRNFMNLHRPFFDAAPPEIRARFDTAAQAQTAVEDTQRQLVQQREAYENSAARFYLDGRGQVRDPLVAIRGVLNSDNPVRNAADLMKIARTDPNGAAAAGIQRNAVEYVLNAIRSTTQAGTTSEKQIAKAALDKLVNGPRTSAALDTLVGKDGADWLRAVAKDLDREAMGYNAIKIPGSPGTAADLHAMAGHGGHHNPSVVAQLIGGELLGETLGHVVGAVPVVGSAIKGVTTGATFLLNAMRAAGMRQTDELMLAAVRNPEIARLIMLHPSPAARVGVLRKLGGLIGNLSVSGYTTQRK